MNILNWRIRSVPVGKILLLFSGLALFILAACKIWALTNYWSLEPVFDSIRSMFLDLRKNFGGPGQMPMGLYNTIILTLKLLGILVVLLLVGAYSTYVERKILAFMQDRLGPTRVGPRGILQPIADGLKLLQKECIVPLGADRNFHYLAPVICFIPALMGAVIIPFGKGMIPVDLNVGILYFFALGAFGELGIFLAAWGSNNKYSAIAGFRAVAQLVSYEIPMAFAIMSIVVLSGSLKISDIINAQIDGITAHGGLGFPIWFIVPQFLGFLIFFLSAVAETNRTPFDLAEAESELVSGFHTEYTGLRWAFFFLAEYVNIFIGAAIIATMYLGGYAGPELPFLGITLSSVFWFCFKVFLIFFIIVWLRGTLPRLRVDQLMMTCWKRLIPISMANFLLTGIFVLANTVRLTPQLWSVHLENSAYTSIAALVGILILMFGLAWYFAKDLTKPLKERET
tara:strand:- start:5281 stop:6645 length:1365 start_codon:yes stop_codon:yes gene_type:complete